MIPIRHVGGGGSLGDGPLQGGAHGRILVPPGQVKDLEIGRQASERGGDDLIEMLGAQGTTGDEKGRRLRIQAESRRAPAARPSGPIGIGPLGHQSADGRPQGQAGDLSTALGRLQTRRGEGQGDGRRPSGAQPVGQTGPGVLLVNDDGHPRLSGGQVRRCGHEAPEADDHLRANALNGLSGGDDGLLQSAREQEEIACGASRHGDPGHIGEVIAGLGHEAVLQTLLGAQHQELGALVPARCGIAQSGRRGQQRVDVSGGAASREQHAQRRARRLRGGAFGRTGGMCVRHGSSCGGR